MFLAGKKTSELNSETSQKVVCAKCNAKNTTKVSVIGTYKHLFHIPFVSGGKHGTSTCSNCQHNFELDEMPDSIKLAYYELKETTRTPIWHYIGIISIKVLVLIKIFSKYI